MSVIITTVEGNEIPMSTGDRVHDEYNTVAVELLEAGTFQALINLPNDGRDSWVTVGWPRPTFQAAYAHGVAEWEIAQLIASR